MTKETPRVPSLMYLQRELRRAYRRGSFKIQLAKFAVEFRLAKGKQKATRCLRPTFDVSDCIVEHYDSERNRIYRWQEIICACKCIRIHHNHVFSLARVHAIVHRRRRSSKYYFTAPFQQIRMTVNDVRAVRIAPCRGGPGSIPDQSV